MKVSVIICTKGRPKLLLKRSLPSVLNQTFKDYEIMVIENPSEKKYPKLDKKIRYYKNKKDIGLAGSKNKGIKLAKGKYIVFLDDDNEFHPDFLEETIPYLDHGFWAVGVKKEIIYPEGKTYHLPKFPCSINDGWLIKKKVFEKIKFDSNLQANEDADFGIEFFKYFKPQLINKTLMTVYTSSIFNTTSYSNYSDYHLDGLAKFWLKHHLYKEYIGRMFLLSSNHWFRYFYWIEQKLKRYYQIYINSK